MSVSLAMGTALPNVPSGFFSEILASTSGAARRPEKTTVPSMADAGMFILGGATGLPIGGGGTAVGATGRAGGGATGRATGGGTGTADRGGAGGGATGRGGDGGAGRATGGGGEGGGTGRGGGGAAGLGDATGGCTGAGGVAIWGAVAGRGVPQYPQNLLPRGKDL